jgi:inner membrane protein
MDPVCHTLVGAALAGAGLGRRSRLATTAAVIGANLPDVDAVLYLAGDSLYWRRGWTHGIPALLVWPFLLAGGLMAWDRFVGRNRPAGRPRASARLLLLTSAVSILSHPTLDALNNYGLRWLMPFSPRWFYGDALFIVDPWIWLALALGVAGSWWIARRAPESGARSRPARVALGLLSVYGVIMLGLGHAGRQVVRTQLSDRGVHVTATPMVAPVFASVVRRYVVAEVGPGYHVAGFRWWPVPRLDGGTRVIERNADHPAVRAARAAPGARGFVTWSRFPFFVVQPDPDGFLVIMDDARYAPTTGTSWAAVKVRVPAAAVNGGATAGVRVVDPTGPAHGRAWLRGALAAFLMATPCV